MNQSILAVIVAFNNLKEVAFSEYNYNHNKCIYDFCNETLDKLYKVIQYRA